jgi:hypothetical protein
MVVAAPFDQPTFPDQPLPHGTDSVMPTREFLCWSYFLRE